MRSEVSQGPLRPPNHRLSGRSHTIAGAPLLNQASMRRAEDRFMVAISATNFRSGRSSTIGIRPKPEAHDRPLSDGVTLIRI